MILYVLQIIGSFFILYKRNFISNFLGLLDIPDHRKIHDIATPKIGSVIMILSWVLIAIIISYSSFFSLQQKIVFIVTNFLLVFLGYLDDKFTLDARNKIISLIFIFPFLFLLFPDLFLIDNFYLTDDKIININRISIIFSIFCLISIIVAIDLFDGINLICSIFFISKFALFLILYDLNIEFEFINTLLLINLLIFLFFNFSGLAFLSSGGTYLLSFLLGLELIYIEKILNEINALQIVSLLFLPGIDMIRVFFVRLFKTGKIFSADRSHFHHILSIKYNSNIAISLITIYVVFFDVINLLEFLSIDKVLFLQAIIYLFFLHSNFKLQK